MLPKCAILTHCLNSLRIQVFNLPKMHLKESWPNLSHFHTLHAPLMMVEHYSLLSIQVLIFTSSPSKGLAKPPQFPLSCTFKAPILLRKALLISSTKLPQLSSPKSKEELIGMPSFGIQSYGLQEISIYFHFMLEFFLSSSCSSFIQVVLLFYIFNLSWMLF